ncbi:MAG: putative Fe2+ transport system protein, subunit A [Promethearchaeota archaeon]|nr:MAG: putative Fe2+ transport system protein, subunit A [Candidatus Lokiarchaeota archaeon]
MTLNAESNMDDHFQKTSSLLSCLSDCPHKTDVEVVSVNAGLGAKKRLCDLGIVPGTKITKTRSGILRGPVQVDVKGSKIVLGRGLAAKVIVKCNNS